MTRALGKSYCVTSEFSYKKTLDQRKVCEFNKIFRNEPTAAFVGMLSCGSSILVEFGDVLFRGEKNGESGEKLSEQGENQ